ncbi:MAG: hypothetical protein GX801_03080 [Fibrobacter sp.]|nr:hypothetical protein [Fibrobacter sp.]
MRKLLIILISTSFLACAPKLAHVEWQSSQQKSLDFVSLSDSTQSFSQSELQLLHDFYASQLQAFSGHHFCISLVPSYEEQILSPWYFGYLVLGPLWPVQPRKMQLKLALHAKITSPQGAKLRITFYEQENLNHELFWYGIFRRKAINHAIFMMHKKMVQRLNQHILLGDQPVDAGIISDFL